MKKYDLLCGLLAIILVVATHCFGAEEKKQGSSASKTFIANGIPGSASVVGAFLYHQSQSAYFQSVKRGFVRVPWGWAAAPLYAFGTAAHMRSMVDPNPKVQAYRDISFAGAHASMACLCLKRSMQLSDSLSAVVTRNLQDCYFSALEIKARRLGALGFSILAAKNLAQAAFGGIPKLY